MHPHTPHAPPHSQAEYSRRKYNANNPPYQRVFFEFSDEPPSQQGCGGSSAPGSGGDPAQLAFVQGQLRDKDRRIQAVSAQLAEAEERGTRLEAELELARSG